MSLMFPVTLIATGPTTVHTISSVRVIMIPIEADKRQYRQNQKF